MARGLTSNLYDDHIDRMIILYVSIVNLFSCHEIDEKVDTTLTHCSFPLQDILLPLKRAGPLVSPHFSPLCYAKLTWC